MKETLNYNHKVLTESSLSVRTKFRTYLLIEFSFDLSLKSIKLECSFSDRSGKITDPSCASANNISFHRF